MDNEAFRHGVPDTSGEAWTRAGHAISEGRLRWRGKEPQEKAPDAPLYQFLANIGWSLEMLEGAVSDAHRAIDPNVVPHVNGAMGTQTLVDRVGELMGVTREAADELRVLRRGLRALAGRLGMSPRELVMRLGELADEVSVDGGK